MKTYNECMAKKFRELSEREILALAVSLEEEDGRIYGDFADGLRQRIPTPRRSSMKCARRNLSIAPA
jgi:rubrerythrin